MQPSDLGALGSRIRLGCWGAVWIAVGTSRGCPSQSWSRSSEQKEVARILEMDARIRGPCQESCFLCWPETVLV